MKLYYTPLACSLADHIALLEAGASFDSERVDLRTKQLASGGDLHKVTPKGYVPVLVLDNGEVLTENIAILEWIASQYPQLGASGPLGRTRLLEALAFISTELHRSFKPMWHPSSDVDRAKAASAIGHHLDLLSTNLTTDYLFGENPTVADFYLFVMLLWAEKFAISVPPQMARLRTRLKARPSARLAMEREGLI